jgi:hypothetical protein
MKRSWKLVAVGLTIAFLSFRACSLSSRAIDGVVLDESTGKPIAGAIVVVTWMGDESKFVDSGSNCYHAETARTDANGKWHTSAWSRPWSTRNFGISLRGPVGEAYKPGYIDPPILSPIEKILLAPHTGTKDDYFEYLSKIRNRNWCDPYGESRKNLLLFYKAIADEAEIIAETPKQVKISKSLLFYYNDLAEQK